MEETFFKPINPQKLKGDQIVDVAKAAREYQSVADALLAMPQEQASGCRVCGSTEEADAFTAYGFAWARCAKCDHLYKKHMPTHAGFIAWLKRSAPIEIYLEERDLQYRLDQITRPKVDYIKQFHSGKPGRWLDIATGLGDVPHLLHKEGWKVAATEINQSYVDFAAKEFQVAAKNQALDDYFAAFVESKQESFDVVTAFGYFDLLPAPMDHFRMVNKMLKVGGVLGINQPNNGSLTAALARFRPDSSLRVLSPGDYSFYSKTSLCYALEHSGFEVLNIWWHGLDVHELIVRMIEMNPAFRTSAACELLYEQFNSLQRAVDQERKSDFMLLSARKVRDL